MLVRFVNILFLSAALSISPILALPTAQMKLDLGACTTPAKQFPENGTARYFLFEGDSANCSLAIIGSALPFDVSVQLSYKGPAGSVLFSPSLVTIAHGKLSATVTISAVFACSGAVLFGYSTDISIDVVLANSTFGVWAKVPVYSVREPNGFDNTFWTTDPSEMNVMIGNGGYQVCSPVAYSGTQYFCVDSSTLDSDLNNGPFFLLSPSTEKADLPDQAGLVYLCSVSCSSWGISHRYFSPMPGCNGNWGCYGGCGSTLSAIGYAGGVRTSLFSNAMIQCYNNDDCKTRGVGQFDTGCPQPTYGVHDSFFVLPLPQTTRATCATFWCAADRTCLANSNLVCNGVNDCSDGADENSGFCNHIYYCSGSGLALSIDQLCDGVVDCPNSDDEDTSGCFLWALMNAESVVASGNLATSAKLTVVRQDMTVQTCIKYSKIASSQLIAMQPSTGTCIVYKTADSVGFAMNLNVSLVPVASGGLSYYYNIPLNQQGKQVYSCYDGYACSGNGHVKEFIKPTVTNGQSYCFCACNPGYYGLSCEAQLDVSQWSLVLPIAPKDWGIWSFQYAAGRSTFIAGSTTQSAVPIYHIQLDTTTSNVVFQLIGGTQTDLTALYNQINSYGYVTEYASGPGQGGQFPVVFGSGPMNLNTQLSGCAFNGSTLDCSHDGSPLQGVMYLTTAWNLPDYSVLVYTAGLAEPDVLTAARLFGDGGCDVQQRFVDLSAFRNIIRLVSNPEPPLNCAQLYSTGGGCSSPCSFVAATSTCVNTCPVRYYMNPILFHMIDAPAIEGMNTTVVHSSTSYTPFLVSGVMLIVVAVGLGVVAVVLLYLDLVHFKKVVSATVVSAAADASSPVTLEVSDTNKNDKKDATQDAHAHRLLQLIREALTTMKVYAERVRSRVKELSVLSGVVAFNIACVGIFLVVYYATSDDYTSSHALQIEFYHSSQGSNSFFSPAPYAILSVEPTSSKSCKQRRVIGVAPLQNMYVSAVCSNNRSGLVTVSVRIGASLEGCNSAPYSIFPNGFVVAASQLLPQASALEFLQLTCGTSETVAMRFAFFSQAQAASSLATPFVGLAQQVPVGLRQHWDVTSQNTHPSPPFLYKRAAAKSIETFSSSDACRYESLQNSSLLGSLSASTVSQISLLIQVASEAFDDNPTLENTTALQRLFTVGGSGSAVVDAWNAIPLNVTALGPNDGDIAIGFKTSTIGPRGKYYGVVGSYTDIGSYYGLHTPEKDGIGVTMSFYLLATKTTVGFAFAVTDARENVATGFSPLLDQLGDMMKKGSDSTAWFTRGENVYAALYVDGPNAALHFVMANSRLATDGTTLPFSQANAFVDISWDLSSLGLLRLLNGAWHQVAIVLRSENAQTKAQLIVDGKTSTTKSQWNLCVPRKPVPVKELTKGKMPVAKEAEERVLNTGMLYTGYNLRNGGVSKVQFYPAVVDIFDVWLTSTPAARDFNAMNSGKYVTLGVVLLIIGVVFFAVSWGTSGREILAAENVLAEENKKKSFELFVMLWRRKPHDANGAGFQPIPWGVAKHLLGLDNDSLFTFLQELSMIQISPEEELVRLLYIFAEAGEKKALKSPLPLAEDWEKRAVSRAQELANEVDPDPQDILHELDKIQGGGESRKSVTARDEGGVIVRSDNLFFGGTQAVATQQGDQNISVAGGNEIKQLIMPVLTVLQSVYVWLSTLSIPFTYRTNFGSFFSIICADFTAAIAQIPPIATPLAQLFLGMFAVSALFYYLHKDEQAFLSYVGMYALRRDTTQPVGGTSAPYLEAAALSAAPTTTTDIKDERVDDESLVNPLAQEKITVNVLSIRASQQIDQMLARAEEGSDEDTQEMKPVVVRTGSADLVLQKMKVGKDGKADKDESGEYVAACANCSDFGCSGGCKLEHVGCRCAVHTDRFLGSQFQTDLWPFTNRPSCCLAVEGKLCGISSGKMYFCGKQEEMTSSMCQYALCEKHMRVDGLGLLRSDLMSFRRSLLSDGSLLFMTVAMFLCNAFYMPVLKTALMILACHPYFQCLFPTCWSPVDRNYALAVFLSVVIVFFFRRWISTRASSAPTPTLDLHRPNFFLAVL